MKAKFSSLAIVAAILLCLANPALSSDDSKEKLDIIGQQLVKKFAMEPFSGLWYEREFSRYYANEGMAVGLIKNEHDSISLKCVKIIIFQKEEPASLGLIFEFAYRELILAKFMGYDAVADKERLAIEVGWALKNVKKLWEQEGENDFFKTPCQIYITAQRKGNFRVITMRTFP